MPDKMRLVVVDDHPLFRHGVATSLAADPAFVVVAQGSTAEDAVALAVEHLPDVMLLDVSLPGCGIEAARMISVAAPIVKVVILTVSEDREHVLAALEAGARGYVLKGIGAGELGRTLKSISSGDTYITPRLAAHLLRQVREAPKQRQDRNGNLSDLTAREEDVLSDVAQGLTNKEIARRRGISEKTVKHYMTSIMEKLQVRNRVEAALVARTSMDRNGSLRSGSGGS